MGEEAPKSWTKTLGRDEPRHVGQDNPGGVEHRAAQGSQAQDDPGRVLHGRLGDEAQRQRGDEQDGNAGHGDYHEEVPGGTSGPRGLRQARQRELPDDPQHVQGLRPLDRHHMAREWRRGRGSSLGPPSQVAGCSGSTCRGCPSKESHGSRLPDQGALGEDGQLLACQSRKTDRLEKTLEAMANTMEANAPRDGGDQGRTSTQESREVGGRFDDRQLLQHGVREAAEEHLSGSESEGPERACGVRQCMSASQRLSAQLKSTRDRALGPLQARSLEEQAWRLAPEIFQALTGHDRVCLMECACEPDSLLSSAVQAQQKDERAATRCSLFNGCDLSRDEGVRLIMRRIDLERPQHVWLSPPCGPFSPLQRTNQRREALKI